MKKLISLLSALTITVAATTTVISCGVKNEDVSKASRVDIKQYNYVTGPYKDEQYNQSTINSNPLMHSFMGDAFHNYGVYNVENNTSDKSKWEFYGDLENVKKYNNDSINLTAFKNEDVYSQLILISNEDLEDIEIKYEVDDKDLENVQVEIMKADFIYNTWFDENSNRPWKTKFSNTNQRIADSLEPLNSNFSMSKDFLQPIFIKVKVTDAFVGDKVTIKLSTSLGGGNYQKSNNVLNNNIIIDVIDKNIKEYELDEFTLGASPFIFSDIFKYSERDEETKNLNLENLIPFLSSEHKKYLDPKLKSLFEHGQNYIWSWASNMSDKSERYTPVRSFDDLDSAEPTKVVDNAFLDGTNTGLIKWKFDGKNWSFDFDKYDEFMDYIASFGFEKFWAGNLVFDIDVDSDGDFKNQYRKIQYYNEDNKLVYKEMNLNPNEEDPSKNYTKLLTNFLVEFNKHIEESNNEKIQNYIVYDEVNKQTVSLMNKIISENKLTKLKKHAFAGYKWSMDTNSDEEMEILKGNNEKESIHDLVFGGYKIQEMFPDLTDNQRAAKFREISDARRENGLTTMMYAARSTYPSTLVQSDYGDNLWAGFNGVKLGLDGYFKWAFDKWVDNRIGEPGVGNDKGNQHRPNTDPYNDGGYLNQSPAGDELLVYPNRNNGDEFVTSVRWELMHYSQQQAVKLKELEKLDVNLFEEIINRVNWPTRPTLSSDEYAVFDNYFMWDNNVENAITKSWNKVSAGNDSIIAVYLLNKYFAKGE